MARHPLPDPVVLVKAAAGSGAAPSCASPAGGKHPFGDASRKIQLFSEQMLSVHGFAPPAPGRGWKENREMELGKYGQKWSRPGKEQPYGR